MITNTLIAAQVHITEVAKACIPKGKEVYITDKPFTTTIAPRTDTSTLYLKVLGTGLGDPYINRHFGKELNISCQIILRFNSDFRCFEAGEYLENILEELQVNNLVKVTDQVGDEKILEQSFEVISVKPLKVLTNVEQTVDDEHFGEIEWQFGMLVIDVENQEGIKSE